MTSLSNSTMSLFEYHVKDESQKLKTKPGDEVEASPTES